MYTRKDMFRDNAADGFGAHRRFYGEVVREAKFVVPAHILAEVTADKIAADPHMNNVRTLKWWDIRSVMCFPRGCRAEALLRERGDCLSLSAQVCLLKEAVRQAFEAREAA